MPKRKPKKQGSETRLKPALSRAMWSGSISFGLVNIPVKMYSAVKPDDIRFHMLHEKDKARVQQKLVCPAEDREVPRDEIVKGYEISPEQHIVIEEEELRALEPEASHTIDIIQFVDLSEIDPIYYEKPYYLLPDERAEKAYRLLVEAMSSTGKAALGKFVMRNKEYLGALRPVQGVICLETMRYADEVLYADQLEWLPPHAEVGQKELETARQLVASLSGKFDPSRLHNDYHDAVMRMIRKKAEGQEIVVQPQAAPRRQVVDLMSALEQSLAQAERAKSGRKPAAARGGG